MNLINQLNDSSKTLQQNLEIVLKSGKISDKTMRLFAVWCAREVSYLITNDSQKKIYLETLMVAENFAYGKATAEQLLAAWDAARDAALSAARGAAWSAARDAAWSAAWSAALSAARDAALSAASDAAWDAAWGAAWSAAWGAARGAAWDEKYKQKWYVVLVGYKARVDVEDKQKNKLIEMIGEEKENK